MTYPAVNRTGAFGSGRSGEHAAAAKTTIGAVIPILLTQRTPLFLKRYFTIGNNKNPSFPKTASCGILYCALGESTRKWGKKRLGALRMLRNIWTDMVERVSANISVFSVWNIIDILLVTVLIYFTIQLLRRSSAFSVMKGVFFLVLILGLSGIFGLHTLNFLLYSTLQVGVLAAVVLFQPELRKMLGQVGTANLPIGRGGLSSLEKCITDTVDACRSLSWQRQGALIVFERRDPLTDYAETGTVIDAAVTAELLKNIFYPKAPLHDGAVIVSGGRITGAGCMLPLTANQNLSRDLGMRHRAGIGMSESSDAVTVIVSEETGSVSVAAGGMLKRHLAPETLEKLLRLELLPPDPHEGKKGLVSRRIRRKGDGA